MNINEIREKLGAGYKVQEISVTKNNGSIKNGVTIKKEGETIAPTIYIDDSMTADDVIKIYKGSDKPDFDIDMIFTKDYILKNVFPCLINRDANLGRLDDLVNEQYANLSIVFRVKVNQGDAGIGSFMIRDKHLEFLDIKKQELIDTAIANIQDSGEVKSMFDTLSELSEIAPFPIPDPGDSFKMYVISSKDRRHGAGVILDKAVREKLSELLGEYFIIPSSIHELIAVAKSDTEALEIVKIIGDVNRTQLSEEEYLSDNLYEIVDDRLAVVA